ncbi:unnamed protein product, partial [Allacma fusca]
NLKPKPKKQVVNPKPKGKVNYSKPEEKVVKPVQKVKKETLYFKRDVSVSSDNDSLKDINFFDANPVDAKFTGYRQLKDKVPIPDIFPKLAKSKVPYIILNFMKTINFSRADDINHDEMIRDVAPEPDAQVANPVIPAVAIMHPAVEEVLPEQVNEEPVQPIVPIQEPVIPERIPFRLM